MGCKCLEDFTVKLEEMGYYQPDFSSFRVPVVSMSQGNSYEATCLHVKCRRKKVNGELHKNQETLKLFAVFCPFCGKKFGDGS